MRILMMALVLGFGVTAMAQPSSSGPNFGVRMGGGGCSQVIDSMIREWSNLRSVVAPDHGLRKPRHRDFMCINPGVTRVAMPKSSRGVRSLRCYQEQGVVFCCDDNLRGCAALGSR